MSTASRFLLDKSAYCFQLIYCFIPISVLRAILKEDKKYNRNACIERKDYKQPSQARVLSLMEYNIGNYFHWMTLTPTPWSSSKTDPTESFTVSVLHPGTSINSTLRYPIYWIVRLVGIPPCNIKLSNYCNSTTQIHKTPTILIFTSDNYSCIFVFFLTVPKIKKHVKLPLILTHISHSLS